MKCAKCDTYKFAGNTVCGECQQPIAYTSSYMPISPLPQTTSPSLSIPVPATTEFPPPMSWKAAETDLPEAEDQFASLKPFWFMTGFLLLALLAGADIPPNIKNLRFSLSILHIGIFLFVLFGAGKWLITRKQTEKEPKYSGKIGGFLAFPAAGLIVHIAVNLWMYAECLLQADKLPELSDSERKINTLSYWLSGNSISSIARVSHRGYLDFVAPILMFMSILFVAALICFFRKYKWTPFICISALCLYIAFFFSINYRHQDLVIVLSTSRGAVSEYSLLFLIGSICMIVNCVAFILHFLISKRVKATFV